ncbi:MAG: hypothetical protein KF834_01140 [Burkholderiales bacterium]|nr:hypothetical protein [Burkholderiales bacterium]
MNKPKKALSKMLLAPDNVRLPIFSAIGPGPVPEAVKAPFCCDAIAAEPIIRIGTRRPAGDRGA